MAGKTKKTTAASTVRNVRRNSRKRYSEEEKIRIDQAAASIAQITGLIEIEY